MRLASVFAMPRRGPAMTEAAAGWRTTRGDHQICRAGRNSPINLRAEFAGSTHISMSILGERRHGVFAIGSSVRRFADGRLQVTVRCARRRGSRLDGAG